MKTLSACLLLAAVLCSSLAPGQTVEDRRRIGAIQDRMRQGQPVTAEDRAFMQEFNRRQSREYASQHPPADSTGMIPLPELGTAVYKGEQGGLYPGGVNVPPAGHRAAGVRLAHTIAPLDSEGRPSPAGKIVMISTGMSNTTMESQAFQKAVAEAGGVNPKFLFVDCAQGGQVAAITARPEANYWKVAEDRLRAAGSSPQQVQVAWIKQANPVPTGPFPEEVRKLQNDLLNTLHNLHDKYPNLKLAFLSSRIYGGYAVTPLNPEPHAYESGFAVKWLIADQIAGKPELNYDSAKGPVQAPWIAWGPYLWADGAKPRKDGLTYTRDDLGADGTHPSPGGRVKVANLLLAFLKTDPASRPWFLAAEPLPPTTVPDSGKAVHRR